MASLAHRPALALAAACGIAIFAPLAAAAGGSWVPGSSFDPARGVPTFFARYIAMPGEGQMTVRCDVGVGVTIDAAVTGNAETPAGVEIGGTAEASVHLVGLAAGAGPETIVASGEVRLRNDGAVIVSLAGEGAGNLGVALLQPADHAEITIGDRTGSVPLGGAVEAVGSVARACPDWPGH